MNSRLLRLSIAFVIVAIFLTSCGVILDNDIVTGTWKLIGVDFYQYNPTLDTYKIIKSGSSFNGYKLNTNAFFFDNENSGAYKLELISNGTLELTREGAAVELLHRDHGHNWEVSSYESSLTLNIKRNTTALGIWAEEFKLKKFWPMSTNKSLELYIKASELGRSSFTITLDSASGETIEVSAMKGFFELQ